MSQLKSWIVEVSETKRGVYLKRRKDGSVTMVTYITQEEMNILTKER